MSKVCLLLALCAATVVLSCSSMTSPGTTVPVSHAVYYVSGSGNDRNDGTSPSTAWRTIAKVDSERFLPGDAVLFRGGEAFQGSLVIRNSGTAAAWITVGSYDEGRATIDAGRGSGVFVRDAGYVRVRDLVVEGGWNETAQSGSRGAGILFRTDLGGNAQLGAVTVRDCAVSGFRDGGVVVESRPPDGSQSGYRSVTISGNSVHDNGALGITTVGDQAPHGDATYCFTRVRIDRNTVFNNYGVKSHTSGHTGDGIIVGQAGGGSIAHNRAFNNGWYSVASSGGPAAIWCWDSRNLTFQFNDAYHNGSGNDVDGDGFDLDGGAVHCTVQYNYSYDNKGAGFLTWEFGNTRATNSDNTVRFNVSRDNGSGGIYGEIHAGPSCDDNRYYNNTLYTDGVPVEVRGGAGNRFINNIFVSTSGKPVVRCAGASARFLDNDYDVPRAPLEIRFDGKTYRSLALFRTTGNELEGGEAYGTTERPDFVSSGSGNFRLRGASRLARGGLDLSRLGWRIGERDFYGAALPAAGTLPIGASVGGAKE